MMKFQGTSMLQKIVPECRIVPEKMRQLVKERKIYDKHLLSGLIELYGGISFSVSPFVKNVQLRQNILFLFSFLVGNLSWKRQDHLVSVGSGV